MPERLIHARSQLAAIEAAILGQLEVIRILVSGGVDPREASNAHGYLARLRVATQEHVRELEDG
jgi:hypothetical protein